MEKRARDVVVVLLTDAILRMEMNKSMTIGQAADIMLEHLEREGFVVIHKQDLCRAVETAAGKIIELTHKIMTAPDILDTKQ